jgi:hypothetical protein
VPREERIGRHNRGHLGQKFPAQSLGLGGQPTALIVAESKSLVTELLAKYLVLLTKVVNHLQLVLIHPAGDGDQHEPERIQDIRHVVSSLSPTTPVIG